MSELKELLTYPETWGPTEWGPVPFLPDHDVLVQRMEKQWGELRSYRRGVLGGTEGGQALPEVRMQPVRTGISAVLVSALVSALSHFSSTRGLMSTARGGLLVTGLQAGNVFIGVQPALGIEGDPMRLLFERDLTPHPQVILSTNHPLPT